ncbi:MAG: FKBP-type peptidyl-prolyl cis-trans isomerase, partial [Planctomycetes bacterium]|nr:FKBP-type peptidyl-prolyl cis-trans isomerase [Planctomycetota bacterium]
PGAAPATAARPAGTGAAGATNLTAPPAAPPGSTPAAAQLPAGAMTTTPSGLQYAVLKEGEGPTPPPGAKIQVHWTGWLPDGRVFSDTRKGGVPDEFTLHSRDLIKGWVEALSSMKKGEKRKLHVPNGLAYGPQGYHQVVPPRADLDFEIELVSFTPPGGR